MECGNSAEKVPIFNQRKQKMKSIFYLLHLGKTKQVLFHFPISKWDGQDITLSLFCSSKAKANWPFTPKLCLRSILSKLFHLAKRKPTFRYLRFTHSPLPNCHSFPSWVCGTATASRCTLWSCRGWCRSCTSPSCPPSTAPSSSGKPSAYSCCLWSRIYSVK